MSEIDRIIDKYGCQPWLRSALLEYGAIVREESYHNGYATAMETAAQVMEDDLGDALVADRLRRLVPNANKG